MDYKLVDGALKWKTVKTKNVRGQERVWTIIIELVDGKKTYEITKDVLSSGKCPSGLYPAYHTKSGQVDGKIRIGNRTFVKKGKNIGKKNETTPLEQAIKTVNSKYVNYVNKNKKQGDDGSKKDMLFPMLLKKRDEKSKKYAIRYPIYAQYKLDGTRAIYNITTKLYTRGRELILLDYISDELDGVLSDYKSIYIDGELYNPDYPLQTITGIVRKQKEQSDKKVYFYIFDMFDVKRPNLKADERQQILREMFNKSYKYLKLVKLKILNNKKEEDDYYHRALEKGKEGIVLRFMDGIYEFGIHKHKRSYYVRKRKPRFDAEFKVVNWKLADKGQHIGAVIWVLETADGKTFTAVPNDTIENRIKIGNNLKKEGYFESKYKGKMMTVNYSILSKSGLPLQPKVKGVRENL